MIIYPLGQSYKLDHGGSPQCSWEAWIPKEGSLLATIDLLNYPSEKFAKHGSSKSKTLNANYPMIM